MPTGMVAEFDPPGILAFDHFAHVFRHGHHPVNPPPVGQPQRNFLPDIIMNHRDATQTRWQERQRGLNRGDGVVDQNIRIQSGDFRTSRRMNAVRPSTPRLTTST